MITKIIWQTYKDPFDTLPDYAMKAAASWCSLNPGWEYRYMDDTEAGEFVLREYGSKWFKIFTDCPVGVMRADLWRYLVVHKYGGVYADLDAVCKQPVDTWLNPTWRMIVCPETTVNFCQWAFAAEAEHPLLASVLARIERGFLAPDYSSPHFVHILTGPHVWTRGILQGLGVHPANLIVETAALNASPKAVELGFVCHPDARFFHHTVVQHIFGSQKWNDGKYVRWTTKTQAVTRTKAQEMLPMERVFTEVYKHSSWGNGSGPGSTPAFCAPLVTFVKKYVSEHGMRSLCDLGCGDMQWMPGLLAQTGLEYVGVDCVRYLISAHVEHLPDHSFLLMDISCDDLNQLPDTDMYVMKDVLQHWPSALIEEWLRRFFATKPDAHLLVINCNYQSADRDIQPGGFGPLNGNLKPLSLFSPTALFSWDTKTVYRLHAPT